MRLSKRWSLFAVFAILFGGSSSEAQTFIETFNNAPNYTNNWHLTSNYNYGSTQITYTAGNLKLFAAQSYPYPPGSAVTLSTNLLFQGDVDVTFEFDHEGFGRTNVGLISEDDSTFLALAILDTDDTNYLNFLVPPTSTEYEHAGSPYMNRWTTIRIQSQGSAVKFYAGVDGNSPVLLNTLTFTSLPGRFRLALSVGSVPWKSGDNITSFRSVRANPSLAGVDVSSALIPVGWKNAVYNSDGKHFIVQAAWSGVGKFTTEFKNNYQVDATTSSIRAAMIGAYAVINDNNAAGSFLTSGQQTDAIRGYPPGSDQTGMIQVQQAFDVVNSVTNAAALPFMALDAEDNSTVNYNTFPRISAADYVARIADAIWAVWTRGVPAIIYTTPYEWSLTTNNNQTEIQGVALWDADLQSNSLEPFSGYGPWRQRMGLQYSQNTNLESLRVDLDIFDPAIFTLPRPPVGCAAGLRVANLALTRAAGGSIILTGSVFNDSPTSGQLCPALATRINSAVMQVKSNKSSAPISLQNPYRLDTLEVGAKGDFAIVFPFSSALPSGSMANVRLSLSWGGGTRTYPFRVPVP